MLKKFIMTLFALALLSAPAAAQDGDWLKASAPAKNRAAQILSVPSVVIVEVCSEPGNTAPLLVSTEDNPNKSGVAFIRVLPGDCIILSATNLFVTHATEDESEPRGYIKFRIRT